MVPNAMKKKLLDFGRLSSSSYRGWTCQLNVTSRGKHMAFMSRDVRTLGKRNSENGRSNVDHGDTTDKDSCPEKLYNNISIGDNTFSVQSTDECVDNTTRHPVAHLGGSRLSHCHPGRVMERDGKTLRFSPNDPDSLFVERHRLSKGEAFYQFFSAGLSLASLSLILVPSALLFYLLAKKPPGNFEKEKTKPRTVEFNSLNTLLEAKKPTVIFYHTQLSLKTKIYRIILAEVLQLFGGDIDVVETHVDVSKDSGLKLEVEASGGFLFHLLIPGKEPMIATLNNFTSVSLFLEQIVNILTPFGFKITSKSLGKLDSKVHTLQKCLTTKDAELHRMLEAMDSLDDMISQCTRSGDSGLTKVQ